MAVNRPEVWFGVALNADPNDPNVSPVWNDFTSNLRKVTGLERGRNFELDQPMASEPQLLIRDVDELLNPANLSSPHVNLVQPYRECCLLAQWPNAGTGNLLNTGTWCGNKVDTIDPSFEAYTAAAAAPNWMTAVGATVPVISTTTPFQGTKDVSYSVASTTAQQGVSWPVACIPGRQYTSSIYVRQATASTQRISVTDQVTSADPFNTTAASSWSTDRLGNTWTVQSGSASEFNRGSLVATITLNASAAEKIITVDSGTTDHTLTVRLIAPDPATVGNLGVGQGLIARGNGSGNYYNPRVIFRPDGTVGLATFKRVAGVGSTVMAEVATGWAYQAGQEFILELVCLTLGTTVTLNSIVWPATKPRPAAPQNAATDGSLITGTQIGVLARSDSSTGITYPFTTRFAAFNAVSYLHGSTTATTGAYVRLSATFTATQPTHTVQLATTGTAVAGAVLADAVQHEQAAAPSAFTTTGPVIYPVMRNLIEQWPRIWESGGFEGFVDAPCVDGLAALQAIPLETEAAQAVLDSGPDIFWRLNDGTQTGLFADTSGNGALPLRRFISKYGPGTDIEPGSSFPLPGDAGGTGVAFTAVNLGAGTSLKYPGVLPGGLTSAGWAMSFACWVQLQTNPTDANQAMISVTTMRGGGAVDVPFTLFITSSILQLNMSCGSGVLAQEQLSIASIFDDGRPHFIVGTASQTATTTRMQVWLDGVASSGTPFATSVVGLLSNPGRLTTVGADADNTFYGKPLNGLMSTAAVWNRVLTNAEIATLYTAGATGYAGETTGARTLRRLTGGNRYTGPTRITQAGATTPQTTMQAASWTGVKDLLTDELETSGAEQGTFWAAADGAVVAESRQDRWLRLTSSFVIGEDSGAGEVPYLMDGARFVADPLYAYADVQIGRINGVTAQGGTAGDIAIAARRYFRRGVQASFDFANDDLPQGMANYIFNTHDAPMLRVDELTIDPSSNTALWPFVLSLEIGKRGTAKRRPKAANGGAGITMSADYFVEKIGIPVIDFDTWEWMYHVQLSPINAGGTPTLQPWILGDTTYGVLNSTTVPGF